MRLLSRPCCALTIVFALTAPAVAEMGLRFAEILYMSYSETETTVCTRRNATRVAHRRSRVRVPLAKASAVARTERELRRRTRARGAGGWIRSARLLARWSTRRPLQYGESDDPSKMTYSRMAFFGRPCSFCKGRAKILVHARAPAVRTRSERQQQQPAQARERLHAAHTFRALSIAPCIDDEVEEDGSRRKEAAARAAAARGPARGLEHHRITAARRAAAVLA